MFMRVIHLTVLRNLSGGQRKQLQQERIASSALIGINWDTVAIHDGYPQSDFERRTPVFLRMHFLRFFYAWYVAYTLSRKYDILLMRHATFDVPGALFSRALKNRVSVHHSREVEELPLIKPGRCGQALAAIERFFGGITIRNARAVLGVTRQISEYEVQRSQCPEKPRSIYPNTLVSRLVEPVEDRRHRSVVHAAFICGRFTAWHGLDLLVDDAKRLKGMFSGRLRVHLIGKLSERQRISLAEIEPGLFEVHGHLSEKQYRRVLAQCDIGIGSLALSRQLMTEGSTLKMCETLAMGLPVYSGSPDVVLPPEFRFCEIDTVPSLGRLYDFGLRMKNVQRDEVKKASVPYIEKQVWMLRTSEFLREVL